MSDWMIVVVPWVVFFVLVAGISLVTADLFIRLCCLWAEICGWRRRR